MLSNKIIELRRILAERFPQETFPPQTFIQTGLTCFDQKLGGGLLRGALTQVVTSNLSSGSTLVLHEIIEAMHLASQFVALVDGTDCFEPTKNTDLLLWIRCQNAYQAVKATDLLLRDGNVALTILDLKQNDDRELRKIPATTWYRLRRVAEEARTTLLLMARHHIAASAFFTLQSDHQLEFADLSRFYSQILLSLSPELIPRKSLSEYQYAEA
jgi:RecA/RadA recombinase